MAEIAASLLGPAIVENGGSIVATIKRQFNYLRYFNSNIQSLRVEAENLKNVSNGLQMRVDTATRNIEVIFPAVEAWLKKSKEIQVEGSGIDDEIKNARSGCFAIKLRFSLSKKAKETAEAMKAHRESCHFDGIAASPATIAPITQGPSNEFASRKQIEEEIMEDLKGRKIHMMGICGMGGVGKTTMAKKIMTKVRKENVFEEVVMVVISQEVRMLEIQREIADKLGLKLPVESLSARADRLHTRLKGPKKSILLILDDVWEGLNLEDLGIPCKRDIEEGCTIMLTSRNRDVLSKMDAKPYAMKILFENEAWSLFREKVGTWVDDSKLLSIAKEVEKECKGLPIALVIVGTTLKNETNKPIWEDALHQLKRSNPTAMPDVLSEVYKPLKLSYDFLDNPDARSLFLLCCLFPEDHDILLEYLTMYGMGLRMFDGITSLEEARNRIRTLVKMLKGRFLLLDGRDESHVKMHDVVRDVAIFIASQEGRIDHKNLADSSREESIDSTWISVSVEEINKLSIGLNFPSLHLLLINKYSTIFDTSTEPSLPSSFFKGKEELNVLSFRRIISFRSLPETTQLLKKLRTLYLYNCYSLETISIVGELLSLEILICHSCGEIAELPVEIGRLKRLKLLEVSDCESLKRIAPGVISNLVQLEELMIIWSFDKWETKGNAEERDNAALCELEPLKNLTRLEIDIADATLAAEEIRLPSKIAKYCIKLGATPNIGIVGKFYERSMYLNSNWDITFGEWFYMFIRSTEFLYAGADCANNLDIAQAQKMKELSYAYCPKVNKLVNITTSMDSSVGVFPHLESLGLHFLPNLEEICDGPIPKLSNSFGNLEKLSLQCLPALRHIWKSPHQNISLCNLSSICLGTCDKLQKLFQLSIAKDGLLQLETLEIYCCEMMEEVFSNEENEKDGEQYDRITFPKLKSLELLGLPRLITFCKGSESIDFPQLEKISIEKCGKLKSLISCTWNSQNLGDRDDSFHVFCNQKVIFGNLKEFFIKDCNGIRSLFSSSIAENLDNLQKLNIQNCNEMVKVIEYDEEMLTEKSLLPRLNYLRFNSLPKLESFCKWRRDLQLPSSENVHITNCPLLESFTMESESKGGEADNEKIEIEEEKN